MLFYNIVFLVFVLVVEAVVKADSSSSLFGQMKFILIMAFVALAVLVILIVGLILYRHHNLKSKHVSASVDLEKLQKNPIYEQHTNYYVHPELLSWAVPRNTMEFIKELGPGNGEWVLDVYSKMYVVVVVKFLIKNSTYQNFATNFVNNF